MNALQTLFDQPSRVVAGLMSGTSLDGVDAVVVRLDGSGPELSLEPLSFVHVAYPDALRDLLLRASAPETSAVDVLTRLNVRLGSVYADAVERALDAADLTRDALDLVGSHGQTVHHLPEPSDCAGEAVRATLQIGDPSTLAQLLDTVVVGNFRMADVALGGQGAPLVPYFDYVAFADATESRLLLNLGGIANLTVLPAGAAPDAVRAFDTGPANIVVDALANRLLDAPFDAEGRHAAAGTPDHDLLADLLHADYFQQPPPKSTGREAFGRRYVDAMLEAARRRDLSTDDVFATATLLSAASVYQAYARFVRTEQPIDVVLASGGGTHNDTLMQMLRDAFAPIPVRTVSDVVDVDAKEATCFAVLAHETINGVPTGLPSVTGASRPSILGSISVP